MKGVSSDASSVGVRWRTDVCMSPIGWWSAAGAGTAGAAGALPSRAAVPRTTPIPRNLQTGRVLQTNLFETLEQPY